MPKTFDVELDEDQLLAQEEHLQQGGLFVPAGKETPEVLSDVKVRLKTPSGTTEVDAQVVQVIPGGGVGLTVDKSQAEEKIGPLIKRALDPNARESAGLDNIALRIKRMTTEEKKELAKHGDRNARMAMMRDVNKAMHMYVLQNEQITPDEIRHMATLRTINPNCLAKIAQDRKLMRDKQLVMNIVCNPKTPPQYGKLALDKLGFMELRRLIKLGDVPPHILQDARNRMKKIRR